MEMAWHDMKLIFYIENGLYERAVVDACWKWRHQQTKCFSSDPCVVLLRVPLILSFPAVHVRICTLLL